jgi:hypothetical protein
VHLFLEHRRHWVSVGHFGSCEQISADELRLHRVISLIDACEFVGVQVEFGYGFMDDQFPPLSDLPGIGACLAIAH